MGRKRVKIDERIALPGYLPNERRPRCPQCGRLLRCVVVEKRVWVDRPDWTGYDELADRIEYRGYGGVFDSMWCAVAFGAAAYEAGYRRAGA